MKKILIICYGYLKEGTNNANSECMREIISEVSNGYEVHVITNQLQGLMHSSVIKENNTVIHAVPGALGRKTKASKRTLKDIYLLISKTIGFQDEWVANVYNYLECQLNLYDFSAMISVSFPFETVIIGEKLKRNYPALPWLIYELDPYANNRAMWPLAWPLRMYLETRAFIYADKILLTNELYRQYSRGVFANFKDKFYNVGLPLLKDLRQSYRAQKVIKEDFKCDVVFAGAFYEKIRRPDYCLAVFEKVSKLDKIRLHIYGSGCEGVLAEYKKRMGDSLILHGRVPRSIVLEAICRADILLNIGNTVTNQVPSKVFEYIGTGKPIISFYTSDQDTSKVYLDSYDFTLLLKEEWDHSALDANVKKVIEFCKENLGQEISYKEIELKYHDYTLKAVTEKIEKLMG